MAKPKKIVANVFDPTRKKHRKEEKEKKRRTVYKAPDVIMSNSSI